MTSAAPAARIAPCARGSSKSKRRRASGDPESAAPLRAPLMGDSEPCIEQKRPAGGDLRVGPRSGAPANKSPLAGRAPRPAPGPPAPPGRRPNPHSAPSVSRKNLRPRESSPLGDELRHSPQRSEPVPYASPKVDRRRLRHVPDRHRYLPDPKPRVDRRDEELRIEHEVVRELLDRKLLEHRAPIGSEPAVELAHVLPEADVLDQGEQRSEEHTSALQS